MTLRRALQEWLAHGTADLAPSTVATYRFAARHLADGLGDTLVTQLQRAKVREYLKKRTDEGAGGLTLRKELQVLRSALQYALDASWTTRQPEDVIPAWRAKYTPKSRWLTQDEVVKLVAQLEPHRAAWVMVGVFTGARAGELNELRWIDLVGDRLHIRGTKSAKGDRWVAVPARLVEMLPPRGDDAAHILQRWAPKARSQGLERACKRAGIPRCTAHDLRRTYGSWLKQAGVGSGLIAGLLGHADTKLVDLVYAHLDQPHLDAAARRLALPEPAKLSSPGDAVEP